MFLDVAGQRLNVAAFGAGQQTLLAISPWIFGWELWQCTLELLSPTWRTVAYDHRGSGESPAAPETITLAAFLDDLFGVMDVLQIERCVLATDSAASLIGFAAVLQQPERFAGLVTIGGIPTPLPAWPAFTAQYLADPAGVTKAFVAASVPGPQAAHLRCWLEHIGQRSDPAQAARFFAALEHADVAPRLAEVRVPTLVIHGSADAIVPVSVAEMMTRQIPESRLVALPEGDHGPVVSQPREVAAAIQDYFLGSRH